jgi:hypothetical protein
VDDNEKGAVCPPFSKAMGVWQQYLNVETKKVGQWLLRTLLSGLEVVVVQEFVYNT